jgi:hypothetical protein
MRKDDPEEPWVRTLDYAPRTKRAKRVNWKLMLAYSVAATILAWAGFAWSLHRPTDFETVLEGLTTSTVSCLGGGVLLALAIASLAGKVTKPSRGQFIVLAFLTVSQWLAWYVTDMMFIRF